MEYSILATPRNGYLHVRITGDNNASTIRRYLKDMLAACVRENRANVLIEEHLEGPRLRIGEIFQIISENVDDVRHAVRVMAFVDTHPGREPSNLNFGETVSGNRGMVVRGFETLEEAEAWLLKMTSEGDA